MIAERAQEMRASLLEGYTSDILRLSVDRVVCTWLAVYLFDLRYPDVTRLPSPEANPVIKQKLAAERRHQGALRTLASVKQLLPERGGKGARGRGRPKAFSPSVAD